ncbi:MAG: response regulator [Roseicyclus sp.]
MSGPHALDGRHVLVVEDEYLLAEQLAFELRGLGAAVLGPTGSVDRALDLVAGAERLDGAVVDVNLNGDMAFPVVDALLARGVPVVFATGYDRQSLPARYADLPNVQKPVDALRIARALMP